MATTTTQTTQTTAPAQTSTPTQTTGHGQSIGQSAPSTGHTPNNVINQLNVALRRMPMQSGGGGSRGGGGGGGGPGRGGGGGGLNPPGAPAPASQGQAPIIPAGDVKAMGQLPQIFSGERDKVDDFIEEVKAYFQVNEDVAGYNSPIKKVAFTLTLIKGDQVAGWVRDMGTWVDGLNHIHNNFPIVWTQFLNEFEAQFQDLNKQQHGRMALEKCKMQWPNITQYISDFERYA